MHYNQEFRSGIKWLCQHATRESTTNNYNTNIKFYWEYCDKYDKDYFDVSSKQVLNFIWYLYKYTSKRHTGAEQCITALGNYWKLNGFDWNRKQHPTIRMMLTGYRDRKPSIKRERNPFSFFHMQQAFEQLILTSFLGAFIGSALIIGYYYGGRASEYSVNSRKDWNKVIRRKDLVIIDDHRTDCYNSIIIDFRRHKTNRFGTFDAKVPASCACDTGICPTRVIMNYLRFRKKKFGKAWNLPLLLNEDGRPLKSQHLNNIIKNLIAKMGLDPNKYASHSLRSGRATDLARAKKSAVSIKKWGRWRSDIWQDFYAKLDFNDIAKLSKTSPQDLGLYDNELCALSQSSRK